jgi:hypothetical protein
VTLHGFTLAQLALLGCYGLLWAIGLGLWLWRWRKQHYEK